MAPSKMGFGQTGERGTDRANGWGGNQPVSQPNPSSTTTAPSAVSRTLPEVRMITPEKMIGKISRFILLDFEGSTMLRLGPHSQHKDMLVDVASEIKQATGKTIGVDGLSATEYVEGKGKLFKYLKGGGKVLYEPNFDEGVKCIFVYGESLAFGEADYSVVIPLLKEAYPEFKIIKLEEINGANTTLAKEVLLCLSLIERGYNPTMSYEGDIKPMLKQLVKALS
jgi:hypothetical protein